MGTRYRWAVLALGVLAQASFTAYSQGLGSLGPVFRSQLSISLVATGTLLTAVSIGTALTLVAWGLLTDRIGERAVLGLGLGGAGVCLGLAAFSTSFLPLLAWLVAAGMFGACSISASGRAVLGWFGGAGSRVLVGYWSDRRGGRLGLMRLIALAGALTLAAVALLADAPSLLLVPLLLVTGVISMSSNGLGFTATGEIAGHARAATAMGFQNTALFVAGTIAPIGFGALVTVAGWQAGFAALALLAAAAWLVLRPLERLEVHGWVTAAGDGIPEASA